MAITPMHAHPAATMLLIGSSVASLSVLAHGIAVTMDRGCTGRVSTVPDGTEVDGLVRTSTHVAGMVTMPDLCASIASYQFV